jgi:hypothetical protein
MIQETFIDGIQEIGFGQSIIRINLASLSATQKDDKIRADNGDINVENVSSPNFSS